MDALLNVSSLETKSRGLGVLTEDGQVSICWIHLALFEWMDALNVSSLKTETRVLGVLTENGQVSICLIHLALFELITVFKSVTPVQPFVVYFTP